MEILLLIIGIVLLLAGIALNVSINRRRFYRRGPGGLQYFESYGKAIGTSFLERVGKLLAILLILGGIIFHCELLFTSRLKTGDTAPTNS